MVSDSSNPGQMLKQANPSTIQDKFLVGYQGWFTCPGDGEPVGPGHHGWLHWFNCPIPDGGRPNTDAWPDVSSYSPSELFPAPGLKTKSGEQTFLFSSRNPKTVQRHFHWMAEHGVDGVFLQRFAGQCDLESGNKGIRRIRDEVGERVREAAEREGRVFAIMYDVSGVPSDRIQRILERDWIHLVHNLGVLDSPNYLKERGKPVVALWGFGFDNSGHTPALVRAITQFFRNSTPGGVYIMGGAPAHWRTAESDADRNPEFLEVWLNEFDAISPWTVGRYRTEDEADNFAETKMKGDSALIKSRNEEGTMRKVDYIPVVLPGGSGYNLSEGKWGFNDIKRVGGRFLWRQIYNARRLGVRTIYGAMWDEYDEGTAFMPIVEHKRNLPESSKYLFLSLDEDGYDLPSDWYMRICGFAAEGLRNERRILETFPVKELQDYWSSRPRYEDVNPKSKNFVSGSLSPSSSAKEDAVDPGGGQTYQEWLALQKEEKNEVPPPPYTLEVDESRDPIPSQTVTNDTTTRVAAIATTPEVPSVTVQNVPAVATIQPVAAASPSAVNNSTYPMSAAPVSQGEAYSQISAQSPHPHSPGRGHSPQTYPTSGGVPHPQSRPSSQGHSPKPYPLSGGASQHSPQSHPPTRVYSPQLYPTTGQATQSYLPHTGTQLPQSYPPTQVQNSQSFPIAGGQSAQLQYATAQGQLHPITGQAPSGGAQQSPHSYGPLPQGQSPHGHSPTWGQAYPPTGTSSYHGYPAVGAPSQGYISPSAPSAQSYPPSGVSVHPGYSHAHDQSQDSVNTLANDFGRQSISGPIGGGGRLPTPPPLHPAHPGHHHPSRPTRPPTAPPRHSSQSENQPQSESGHHSPALPSSVQAPTAASTQNRPRWPPVEWDSDTPPIQQYSTRPGRKPSPVSGVGGVNMTRPQTFSASHKPSGGSALRPTSSMGDRPPSRPNTTSNTNTPPAHYSPPISESNNNMNRHDHSSSYGNASYTSTSPSMHGQHGPPIGFPTGPQYNPSYPASSYGSTSVPPGAWPGSGPGHVSPSHSPNIAFPGSQLGYSVPGSSYGSGTGSQYPSGPSFPSHSSSGSHAGNVQFPQVPGGGGGGYYGGNNLSSSSSPPFPNQGYPQSPPAPWMSTGPPMHSPPIHSQYPGPSMNYSSGGGGKPFFPGGSGSNSGPIDFALHAVDKVASRVEKSSNKLFSKFTK